MRNFIEIDSNSELTINPQIYSLAPFRVLYERDKTEDKRKVRMDLNYIFWMADYRSYVSDITDEDEKEREVISIISEDGKYKPDKKVKEALELYRKDRPMSLNFLNDVKCAINELRKFFRELDLTDVDGNGKLKHNAKQVMDSIKSSGDLLEALDKHEMKVKKDIDMQDSARGEKTKGIYED